MGDPRQAWENLQKNLQRMQQQGKRYVRDGGEMDREGYTELWAGSAQVVLEELPIHEELWVAWRVC